VETEIAQEVYEAIKAGHWRNRHAPVGLVDILERVDSSQRWLVGHRELDDALRQLTESGAISEVGQRMYVAQARSSVSAYRNLSKAEYDEAVTRYKDEFADNVASVARLPLVRRLAGSVDTDHVAISFAIDRVADRFGGRIGDEVGTNPLTFAVSLPLEADRDSFVAEVRQALEARSLIGRETWVTFADGARAQVGGLT
jgi:hypothetical protein